MTFDVEFLTVELKQCQKQLDEDPEAETELASTTENLKAVSRDAILCDISSPMQVSACQRSAPHMTLCTRR